MLGVTIKLSSHNTFFFIVLATRLMFDFVETGGRPFVFPLATLGDGQTLECSGILDGVDVVQSCIYGNKKSLLINGNQFGYSMVIEVLSLGDEFSQ